MPTITLPQQSKSIQCEEGSNLYTILSQHNIMDGPCGGCGTCGKCRVEIDGKSELACLYSVEKDISVITELPQEGAQIVSHGYHLPFTPDAINQQSFGIVVDIGTTTLVVSLFDLLTAKELYSAAMLNPQKICGQDVITRINYTVEHENGLTLQKNLITGSIDKLVRRCCQTTQTPLEEITSVIIAGNTTMIHLLAGINPLPLATAPFSVPLKGSYKSRALDLGLTSIPQAEVFCLPAISAYVGGDIVAGILACDLLHCSQKTLFIDIGTNGEIVLCDEGRLICCSCAAGPALEGMNISCGMRAQRGAIERISIKDNSSKDFANTTLSYATIGEDTAKGICGSGIVDAIGEAVCHKLVNSAGRLNKDHPLVVSREGKLALSLDQQQGIVLTQSDIRQIQLAKGAILSGIQCLLDAKNLSADEIERVIVAGQFGAHLSPQSLVHAGFFPSQWKDRIEYAGNTSQSGGMLCLFSKEMRDNSIKIPQSAHYLELSSLEGYEKFFIKALTFETPSEEENVSIKE